MTEEIMMNGEKSPEKAAEVDAKAAPVAQTTGGDQVNGQLPVQSDQEAVKNGHQDGTTDGQDWGFDAATLFQLSHKFYKGKTDDHRPSALIASILLNCDTICFILPLI